MARKKVTWKLGVAFIRGLNMFGRNNISEKDLRSILRDIERENPGVRFLGVHGNHNDTVVFRKRGIHYASVGKLIEEKLSKKLSRPIYVTTRSFKLVSELAIRWWDTARTYQTDLYD